MFPNRIRVDLHCFSAASFWDHFFLAFSTGGGDLDGTGPGGVGLGVRERACGGKGRGREEEEEEEAAGGAGRGGGVGEAGGGTQLPSACQCVPMAWKTDHTPGWL